MVTAGGYTWTMFWNKPTEIVPKKVEPKEEEVKGIIVDKTFKNGCRYSGTIKNAKAHGYGEYYSPDGSLKVKGFWQNNEIIRG